MSTKHRDSACRRGRLQSENPMAAIQEPFFWPIRFARQVPAISQVVPIAGEFRAEPSSKAVRHAISAIESPTRRIRTRPCSLQGAPRTSANQRAVVNGENARRTSHPNRRVLKRSLPACVAMSQKAEYDRNSCIERFRFRTFTEIASKSQAPAFDRAAVGINFGVE